MSVRNSDASILSQLKRDRTQASFCTQRRTLQNQVQTGVFVAAVNPQSGVYDATRVDNFNNGNFTTYYRASPATIVSVPCDCGTMPVQTSNENVPIAQPVSSQSPQ